MNATVVQRTVVFFHKPVYHYDLPFLHILEETVHYKFIMAA